MTYTDPNYSNRRYNSYVDQYRDRPFTHPAHLQPQGQQQQQQPITVKVEDVDSSDIPHAQYAHHPSPSHYYRFGGSSSASPTTSAPVTPFTFMSGSQWPPAASSSHAHAGGVPGSAYPHAYPARMHSYSLHAPLDAHAHHHHAAVLPPLPPDEYGEDEDEGLTELPPGAGIGGAYTAGEAGLKAGEKQVRRRSSKACDQCRKSKCKCERSTASEPCKNCVLLGTPCTFLGPSRKRGPPKGYIDAIEARLHQTEALVGILIASKDSRAKTLLQDLSEDALAKEIIERVNNSPYGHKGRKRGAATTNRARPAQAEGSSTKEGGAAPLPQSTHPSSEWQDAVTAHLNERAVQRNTLLDTGESFGEIDASSNTKETTQGQGGLAYPPSPSSDGPERSRSSLAVPAPDSTSTLAAPADIGADGHRRQRRRVDGGEGGARSPSNTSLSGRSQSPAQYACLPPHPALLPKRSRSALSEAEAEAPERAVDTSDEESGSGEDELAVAVGQLSMNEDEQLRYHGKASGLHLLGARQREDGRNEGGIWRFPKSRVWPPLPVEAQTPVRAEDETAVRLPPHDVQEHLLELYFAYVHAQLPILHKPTFMELWRTGNVGSAASPMSDGSSPAPSSSSAGSRHQRIPTLLLLVMFSIAARYSSTDGPPPAPGEMWNAGDAYMEHAKVLLDGLHTQSRPSTVQALLLLGYREVGIGAMAQAWLYIGMAVRMAQDLGLHKNADKWSGVGRVLFTDAELQERRRVWYGCVLMDKYISAYIGRPVAIFENDFDTELPETTESDESEGWIPHPSPVFIGDVSETHVPRTTPVTIHAISCFNESAKLSIILSMVMQSIYPIRTHSFRQVEFARLEQLLDRWYIDLPEHLRFDPTQPKYYTRPPHVLTLHMQYWCTVLLLHRPFIRHLNLSTDKSLSPGSREAELRTNARRNYDQCVKAANQITAIVAVYTENYCPRRASVFMCFYVFTAAIMHISTLTTYPADPQATDGLRKCMYILERMHFIWPAAWRANQLLQGSKALPQSLSTITLKPLTPERHKRSAGVLDAESTGLDSDGVYRQAAAGYADSSSSSSQPPSQFALSLELPPAEAPAAFYQSYPRWNTDANLPLAGGLTTTGLPAQYSTGLVDERVVRSQDRPSRYPQYWNDYSAMGQMDATYGMPVMGEMQPQGQPPQPSAQQQQQQQADTPMYVQDQYSLYNNLPSSNPQ